MKVNGIYLKILRNLSLYKSDLYYEGDKVIRMNVKSSIYVEAYVPDFIDVPIYTRNITELLRLMNDDTVLTFDTNEKGNYLIIDNGVGKVRYKMAKKSIAEQVVVPSQKSIDDIFSKCEEQVIKFNLSKDKYDELMKVSKMLESNRLMITSLNNDVIRLTAYNFENKEDKQYYIDVEVNHQHFEDRLVCQLSKMEYVPATDYTFDIKTKLTKDEGNKIPLFLVTAYMDDKINVRYLSVGEKVKC